MGPYKIAFTISAAPGITNYFIAVLYKTTNPAAIYGAPLHLGNDHSAPANIVFNDLDGGIYIVKVHESVDDATLGNLRHDFNVNAWINKVLSEQRFYHVDGGDTYDPVDGSTNITDPYFDGKSISRIFQEGYRFLKRTVEWRQDTGGILTLLNDINSGSQITNNSNEVWTVDIDYTVINADTTPSDDTFTDIINVTADFTLDGTMYGKTIAAAAVLTKLTVTTPALGGSTEKRGYEVMHDGGNAPNIKVKAAVGEVFRFRCADVNYILLGKGEYVKFVKKIVGLTSKWYVIDYRGQWDRIGEQVSADYQNDNSLMMDGGDFDGTVYIRPYEFIRDKIPLGQKTDYATWAGSASKQGLYAIDTAAQTFRAPLRLGKSTKFVSNVGGADALRPDNVPGGFQAEQVGEVNTTFKIKQADTSTSDAGVGKIALGSAGNEPRDSDTFTLQFNVGKKNAVDNLGAFPLFLI